ncbi:MAG TPA: TlpA disulfide reductase family protein [Chloroflexota bacterium]|nr:TlpA disulfide reductase family protein [Chloroflexota bacterium]
MSDTGRKWSRRVVFRLPLALLAVTTVAGCSSGELPIVGETETGANTQPAAPVVGRLAPEFTLVRLNGEPLMLSDLHGRPVVVNFFATWCGPCKAEMPEFQAAQKRHGDGENLAVLFIDWQESATVVRSFVEDLGIPEESVLLDDSGDVGRLYRVRGMPTTFFIDRDGVIQAAHLGAIDRSLLDRGLAKIP